MNTQLFKDLAFVVFPVRDIQTARGFYEKTLGLSETANWQDQWVEYDVGHSTIGITLADDKHKPGTHGPTVALEVNDFDQVLALLKQRAVPITNGPFDTPVCRGCMIQDPDGNEIMLHARK